MSKLKTEKEKVQKILEYRLKGYSLGAIGKIFHLTRERIRQLIKKYENEPGFKTLYQRISDLKALFKKR